MRFSNMGPAPKLINPKEGKLGAKKFLDKFGGLFLVMKQGMDKDKNPVVFLQSCTKGLIEVGKRPDGIYVNGKLFATEW